MNTQSEYCIRTNNIPAEILNRFCVYFELNFITIWQQNLLAIAESFPTDSFASVTFSLSFYFILLPMKINIRRISSKTNEKNAVKRTWVCVCSCLCVYDRIENSDFNRKIHFMRNRINAKKGFVISMNLVDIWMICADGNIYLFKTEIKGKLIIILMKTNEQWFRISVHYAMIWFFFIRNDIYRQICYLIKIKMKNIVKKKHK